jgi:hypothetical protein
MERYSTFSREVLSGTDLSPLFGDDPYITVWDVYGDDPPKPHPRANFCRGDRVLWYTETSKNLVKVESDYVIAMHGNIFNITPGQLDAWNNSISLHDSTNPMLVPAPLGDILFIDRSDIEESQEAAKNDLLHELELSRPWTTGDDDADEYLADPEEFLEENEGIYTKEEMERLVLELESEKSGDFGKIYTQLRDGHHRAFGAIQAGERFICVLPSFYSHSNFSQSD